MSCDGSESKKRVCEQKSKKLKHDILELLINRTRCVMGVSLARIDDIITSSHCFNDVGEVDDVMEILQLLAEKLYNEILSSKFFY